MRRVLIPLLLAAACSSGQGKDAQDGGARDTASADVSELDGGDSGGGDVALIDDAAGDADAAQPDAGFLYGAKLTADPAAEIVAVSGDESTVFFASGGRIFSVPSSGGTAADRGPRPDRVFSSPAGDTLWVLSGGVLGVLFGAGTSTPAQIEAGVREQALAVGPDPQFALAGVGASSAAFDLYALQANGQGRKRILPGLRGDTQDCAVRILFVNPFRAMVAACQGVQGRALFFLDLEAATVRTVAADASDFLVQGADRSFLLFLDSAKKLHATDLAGSRVLDLAETDPVAEARPLDRRRFVYRTAAGAIRVARYPDLVPGTIRPSGFDGILAASPSGASIVAWAGTSTHGVHPFLIGTSTAAPLGPLALTEGPTGGVAADPYSDDGAFVFFFDTSLTGGVPDFECRPSDGSGMIQLLAHFGRTLRTFQAPDAVLIVSGLRPETADLLVRPRDGSGSATLLVPQIDSAQVQLFPASRGRVVYRISADAGRAGLYVRPLPSP